MFCVKGVNVGGLGATSSSGRFSSPVKRVTCFYDDSRDTGTREEKAVEKRNLRHVPRNFPGVSIYPFCSFYSFCSISRSFIRVNHFHVSPLQLVQATASSIIRIASILFFFLDDGLTFLNFIAWLIRCPAIWKLPSEYPSIRRPFEVWDFVSIVERIIRSVSDLFEGWKILETYSVWWSKRAQRVYGKTVREISRYEIADRESFVHLGRKFCT